MSRRFFAPLSLMTCWYRSRFGFPVWVTVRLGGFSSLGSLLGKLRTMDGACSDVMRFVSRVELTEGDVSLDLVEVSGRQLGIFGEHTPVELFRRACDLGLELCPADAAPIAFLNRAPLPEQKYVNFEVKNTVLQFAMIPMEDPDGFISEQFGFAMYMNGRRPTLVAYAMRLSDRSPKLDPGKRWVFVQRRK